MNGHLRHAHACAVLLFPALALAHHSSAIYDMSQNLVIDGTVTRVAWANPHVYIHIEQLAASGERIKWAIETYPPAAMRRIGWTQDTLREGEQVTVTGNPTRRTNNRGLFPATIAVAGRTLFQKDTVLPRLSRAAAEAESGAPSLAGTWETLASVDLYLKFYGDAIAVTEAGAAARAAYDEATMLPALDCIPYSSPLLMIDPDFKQISITEEAISISGGFAPAERVVHMQLDTHEGAEPTLQGHSIGRWEGDTLVIDTAAFATHRIGNGYRGTASGAQKRLVERLTLAEQGTQLTYEFELSDPEFLAETVRGSSVWAYRPDLAFGREDCDLANAREFERD